VLRSADCLRVAKSRPFLKIPEPERVLSRCVRALNTRTGVCAVTQRGGAIPAGVAGGGYPLTAGGLAVLASCPSRKHLAKLDFKGVVLITVNGWGAVSHGVVVPCAKALHQRAGSVVNFDLLLWAQRSSFPSELVTRPAQPRTA
jgi:hypothetical protein